MPKLIVHSRRGLLAGAGTFVATLLTAGALVAPAQAASLSPADQTYVDDTMQQALRENGAGGISISITGPAGDYERAYGYANGTSRTVLTVNDHFRIGSVSKTFTATAILQQVELRNLSLSDTVDEFITGIPNGSTMTVRDLLGMRAGLYDYQQDTLLRIQVGLTPWVAFEPEQILDILRNPSHRPSFLPGARTEYSESAYVVLGKILEVVTRRDAEDVINDDVIAPLGLRNTIFPDATNTRPIYSLPTPYATGYVNSAIIPGTIQDVTAFNPNLVWTAGAVISTLGDMQTYARALATGALLSSTMQAQRLQYCPMPYPYAGPTEYGYGLGIMNFGSWLGHSGSISGNGAETFYEPTSGASIAGLEGFQSPTIKIWSQVFQQIAEHLYPGTTSTPRYTAC